MPSENTNNFHVILNPSAGAEQPEKLAEELRELFRIAGAAATILQAKNGADLLRLAREAVLQSPTAVVAGGGDGTMNAVASALVGGEMPLGVLPLGTLNHFAKDLKIPLTLKEAVETIVHGRKTQIDVGQVNDRIFLNNSGLGLYPHLVRDREKRQRRFGWGKWRAFIWAAAATLKRYPLLRLRLTTESEELLRQTPLVFVGNNPYKIEGLNLGVRERIDQGQLCLYIKNSTKRLSLVKFALSAFLGRLEKAKDFDTTLCRDIVVESGSPRLKVSADGEVHTLKAPLHYRIRPGALLVLTPHPEPEKEP